MARPYTIDRKVPTCPSYLVSHASEIKYQTTVPVSKFWNRRQNEIVVKGAVMADDRMINVNAIFRTVAKIFNVVDVVVHTLNGRARSTPTAAKIFVSKKIVTSNEDEITLVKNW